MSEYDRLKEQKDRILAEQGTREWDGWLPTAENINALPEPVRRFVHELETRCDPAGDVRELVIARDTCRQYARLVEELERAK